MPRFAVTTNRGRWEAQFSEDYGTVEVVRKFGLLRLRREKFSMRWDHRHSCYADDITSRLAPTIPLEWVRWAYPAKPLSLDAWLVGCYRQGERK